MTFNISGIKNTLRFFVDFGSHFCESIMHINFREGEILAPCYIKDIKNIFANMSVLSKGQHGFSGLDSS